MSSNKPKDEADRLAEEIVKIEHHDREPGFLPWCVTIDGVAVTSYLQHEDAADFALRWRSRIASTIREAIKGRDRIMTDLLSESEAFCEGWRQGAAAMRQAIVVAIERALQSLGRVHLLNIVPNTPIPIPPSHDDSGKPLAPSPFHLRAQRLEKALREIVEARPGVGATGALVTIDRIAREALEESTNG